jgi:hypothetical protein
MNSFSGWIFADYHQFGLSPLLINDLESLISLNMRIIDEFIPKQFMIKHVQIVINNLIEVTEILLI